MKKITLFLIVVLPTIILAQQNAWKGYFSYNEITDLTTNENKVIASTKNSLFSKETTTGNLVTFTSINEVKPANITTIYQSSTHHTFIGNENGLIIIIKPDGSVINKPDIILEVPVPPNNKKINDFYEYNGKIYVATQYGITVVNLSNLEIDETYYIGNSGESLDILQTTVFNNEIYAVTRTQGIKKALLSNPFLYDYSQWTVFNSGNWIGLVTFNNQLVGANTNSILYKFIGNTTQQFGTFGSTGIKLKTSANYLVFLANYQIHVYNQNLSLESLVYNIPDYPDYFTGATTLNNKLYIGTSKNGVFETPIPNTNTFTSISPNGPIQDYSFRIKKTTDELWITHGGFDRTYAPDYKYEGISIYQANSGWNKIAKENFPDVVSLGTILENSLNKKQKFVCSNHKGLLKIVDKTAFTLLDQTNTGANGLESLYYAPDPNYKSTRPNSLIQDKEGNIWMTNAYVNKALKVLRSNGSWQSYDLSSLIQDATNERYGNLEIDKNGTKWMATFLNGVVAFNEKYNNKTIVINTTQGLPDSDVRCVALDKKGQLWIGNYKGLRIINNVDRFLSENELTATNIVIQEGDLAQELFYQQTIQDIYVDGSNNKWVSIADAGVFQVSSNGQRTLHRFTKENSPLPSNNVLDIEIDEVSGEVFFATDKGTVSFLGSSTKGSDNLENAYVYPNPVRPEYTGTVKIAGLMDKVNLKITDIEGNLVFETTSQGGTVEWDTTAFGKYKVASGVYMIFISSNDAAETTVKKIMIIR